VILLLLLSNPSFKRKGEFTIQESLLGLHSFRFPAIVLGDIFQDHCEAQILLGILGETGIPLAEDCLFYLVKDY
jgi:hypothetical protein